MSMLAAASRLGVALSLLVFALGCAGGAPPESAERPVEITSTGEPAAPSTQQAAESREQTISVRISQGKVEGAPARVEVERGARVRIEVTSDQPDEVHVHGYDQTTPLVAGTSATMEFVAEVPGVFDVETHDSGLVLCQLVVR